MAPSGDYGGPSYSGRNRPKKDGGPNGVQRSYASQLKEAEPLFNTYEHLAGLPRSDAALTMLRKVASIVKPIMRKRGWRVQVLAEFLPAEHNLLGLNINKGYKICIRLRYHNNPDLFLPLEQVVDTMLHELSHNVWGEHDGRFHALWDELRDEHETLVRKGYTGEGFLGEGKKLGGSSGRVPPQHEMRRLARASAEKRKVQGTLSLGSGRRLGGAPLANGQDVREVIAGQVLLRNTINKGCASGRSDATKLSEQAGNRTFKTKAEEDDANDRAIAQAIYELIEEEEAAKARGTFQAAPTDGGLAWSEDHGLYDPKRERASSLSGGHNREPTEDEQLKWAMEESRRSKDGPDYSNGSSFPPESLISPVSPFQAHQSGYANATEGPATSLFSPVSPLQQDPLSAKRRRPEIGSSYSTSAFTPVHKSIPKRSETMESSPILPIDISEPFNPDQWTCEICTCINPVQFLACDACGVERPQGSNGRSRQQPSGLRQQAPMQRGRGVAAIPPPKQKETMGWNCGGCGAFMEHRWWTCSGCGEMKDSS